LHQPTKIPTNTNKVQRISRLESEHQRNQNQIRQLHQRNQELSEEIRYLSQGHIAQKRKSPTRPSSKPSHPKSLRRIYQQLVSNFQTVRIGRYSLMFWLQAAMMLAGVGIICGSSGFMFVRLITGLMG
jgi:hypothetical protein